MGDELNSVDKFANLLRGRKFKSIVENCFSDIKDKYNLKQIDVDILLYMGVYEKVSACDLCKTLNLNKGQVSIAFDRLCEQGYVEINKSDSNRKCFYTLTDLGKEIAASTDKMHSILTLNVFKGFSEKEIALIRDYSERIMDNIDYICTNGIER